MFVETGKKIMNLKIVNNTNFPLEPGKIIKTMSHHYGLDHDPFSCPDCMKSMKTIPGEHYIDPFAAMEKEFYKFIDLDKFTKNLFTLLGLKGLKKSFNPDQVFYKPDGTCETR